MLNKQDGDLVNNEFRRLNNEIRELQDDNRFLFIWFIVSLVIIIGLICAMNYALTGSI